MPIYYKRKKELCCHLYHWHINSQFSWRKCIFMLISKFAVNNWKLIYESGNALNFQASIIVKVIRTWNFYIVIPQRKLNSYQYCIFRNFFYRKSLRYPISIHPYLIFRVVLTLILLNNVRSFWDLCSPSL